MTKHIILTGAMGSGKSTVLNLLQQKGYITVEEPARPILAEQRSIEDEGVPEKNSKLFTQLLLSRAMYQYNLMQKMNGIIIYDRGVPDNIAYAQGFNLDYYPAHLAAKLYRYHPNVFVFPAWEEIYITDDERTMSFEAAKGFGDQVRAIYQSYDYFLIDIPYISAEERVQFIIDHLDD